MMSALWVCLIGTNSINDGGRLHLTIFSLFWKMHLFTFMDKYKCIGSGILITLPLTCYKDMGPTDMPEPLPVGEPEQGRCIDDVAIVSSILHCSVRTSRDP